VSAPLLRLRGLEKRFGAVVALRSVDLEVPGGSTVGVLGANGAGKSTLLRILAGLVKPTAGSLDHVGANASERYGRRRAVGFAGHASLLYPQLTARENLVFAARLYGMRDASSRAEALLSEQGLSEVADRRAGHFSRGMSQRLSIARALVHDPTLVLLDEPFTGLDRRAGDRLAALLTQLRSDGRTLVLTTHDVERASALCDAAFVLERGRVVHRAEGPDLAREALEHAVLSAGGAVAS